MASRDESRFEGASRLDLIGLDVSGRRIRVRGWLGWPVIAAGLVLALGVAALRVDLTRMRYALAAGLASEQQLLDEQRQLTSRMRALRDPAELTRRARALGFVHPERVIDLPTATSPSLEPTPESTALAALAGFGFGADTNAHALPTGGVTRP